MTTHKPKHSLQQLFKRRNKNSTVANIMKMDRMWKKSVAFLAILPALSFAYTRGHGKTVGQPWPMPQIYNPTSDTIILTESMFRFTVGDQTCDILAGALDRYFRLMFPNDGAPRDNVLRYEPWQTGQASLLSVEVTVTSSCKGAYPSLDMDESYDLKLASGAGSLTAKSVWGALRGLETLSQLVYKNADGQYQVNVTTIHDFPRFAWRGVLLDTARHYLPKAVLLQNLDAMSYNKLNVFHWHIVDDQSFPYQSRDYPDISAKGAYDPYTHIYSQSDIQEIIEYGRLRGIRVVPEFDTPGHSQSWGPGVPDLLTKCYSKGQPSGGYGPIDPSHNTTYDFLKGFMKELTEVFPDKYIHLGGDEVSFSCWKSNPIITKFMQNKGFGTDYSKLEGYYMQNLLDIVSSYQSGYIVWQEVFDNGVKVAKDTVVEVWKGHYERELARVTASGYRSILSSCWYLNRISYGPDWKPLYKCDPQNYNGTAEQKALVVGGELCMWGEYVDATNVISRVWPRGSTVAERLWSPASLNNPDKAADRLEEHRCRLIRRGLNAEPVSGPGMCDYEYRPPV